MTICEQPRFDFKGLRGREVEVDFEGGAVTSDGGSLLLAEAERKLGLLEAAAKLIPDDHASWLIEYTMLGMLRARVYGIALDYEDLNDHGPTHGEGIRYEPLLQVMRGENRTAGGENIDAVRDRRPRQPELRSGSQCAAGGEVHRRAQGISVRSGARL